MAAAAGGGGGGGGMLPGLLRALERNYGRFSNLIRPKPIITAPKGQLRREDLEALFAHRACCVHVPEFYPKSAALQLARRLTADPARQREWLVASPGRGLESSDVRTVGLQPYNMVASARDGGRAEAEYFEGAVACMRELRGGGGGGDSGSGDDKDGGSGDASSSSSSSLSSSASLPVLGPLDKLRLELDEIWPWGANVSKDKQGRTFVAGLARVMHGPTRHLEGFIHVDDISPLSPTEGLFSANLYLALPRTGGGELLIYDVEVGSRWDFYRHAPTLAHLTAPGEEGQALLRAKLPPPKVIAPQPGDLVLLCAQRPHAVQGFPLGTRVSIQSFLTFRKDEPLRMDN